MFDVLIVKSYMLSYSADSWFTEVLDIFPEHMVKVCVRGGPGVEITETCPLWDVRYLLVLLTHTHIFDFHSLFRHYYYFHLKLFLFPIGGLHRVVPD